MLGDLGVVSLPRRLLAGLVDGAVGLAAGGALVVVLAAVPRGGSSYADRLDAAVATVTAALGRQDLTRGLGIAYPLLGVVWRNGRGPGARVMGIRRVDAHSDGPVTLRAAATHAVLSGVSDQLLGLLARPRITRFKQRAAEREQRIEQLRGALADDPAELERRTAEITRAGGRDCMSTMIQPVPLGLLRPLSMLLSPRRQTLAERVAGIAWIRVS